MGGPESPPKPPWLRLARPSLPALRLARPSLPALRLARPSLPALRLARPSLPALRLARPSLPALRLARPSLPALRLARPSPPCVATGEAEPPPSPRGLGSGAVFGPALRHLALHDALLQHAHVVDHQHAVEVIVCAGWPPRAGPRPRARRVARPCPGPDGHLGGALDFLGDAGEREAALGGALLALLADELGVDEDVELARLVLGGDVDEEDAVRLADLRGGQADAGRGVHGLGHVVDELLDLGGDRLRARPSAGAGDRGSGGCCGSPCAVTLR